MGAGRRRAPARDFIAIAARSSLLTEIDLAMLEPVVDGLRHLPDSVFVGINVTGQTLARTPYADLVINALDRDRRRPSPPASRGHRDDAAHPRRRRSSPMQRAGRPGADGGTSTTSAPGTPRSATCATCPCAA